ncbi:MAG: LuxR C-terminal-related transcriptional regulator [Bacteroidota bacterium]
MKSNAIQNVLHVWETKNKITRPAKKEHYFEVIGQMANLFAAGSFYYYILDFEQLEMELVHHDVKKVLGIEPEKFTVKRLLGLVHPEDIEKMHKKEAKAADFLLNRITKEEIPLYKVIYLMRLKHASGIYKTILHQAITLIVSEGGKIQKVLGIHTDVSYLNMQVDHKISFISSSRPSFYSLETDDDFQPLKNNCKELFTLREMEIIKKMAEGKDFNTIASEFYISPHTVKTHKRNILRKSGCKNITELVAKCVREGVI